MQRKAALEIIRKKSLKTCENIGSTYTDTHEKKIHVESREKKMWQPWNIVNDFSGFCVLHLFSLSLYLYNLFAIVIKFNLQHYNSFKLQA